MAKRVTAAPPIESVAAVTQRLAVLLAAGVAPSAAWHHLGTLPAEAPQAAIIAAAARAADDGDGVAAAISRAAAQADPRLRAAWSSMSAAWFVATEAGAPLANCLRDLAAAFRSIGQTERDLQIAFAGPAATARMVMALPVVGLFFGFALGFNTVGVLVTTVPGLVCLGAGAGLMLLGGVWNRRMIRHATPTDVAPGLVSDLMSIAMSGGGSIVRARDLVDDACSRFGITVSDVRVVDEVIELSRRAGVPAGELLRSEAEQARREARSNGERAAANLAVKLMMPLGICVLPAFMLVGVAPLLLSIIASTVRVL